MIFTTLPLLLALVTPDASPPFAIEVIDDRTGRGVPLVELKTVNGIRLWTDSAGIAAFDEPGLRDRKVYFHVKSPGYEFAKDGFGYRGKALDVRPGGSARLALTRINIAERLYRVTGAGIYRDSVLTGRPVPTRAPVLNGQVLGSDSVLDVVYHGKIHWFWGDTNRPGYPLGNFHTPGAISRLPADGGLDPDKGIDLDYFVDDDGFARPTAKMPGNGPTWLDGLFVIKDREGRERMFAEYVKVRNMLDIYERGLVEYDPGANRFEKVATFDLSVPNHPAGHPFLLRSEGVEYVYFATPYPLTRVRAEVDDLTHPERYEAFTCLEPGGRLDHTRIERRPDGTPRYAWKRDTPALRPNDEAKLVKSGVLKPDETLLTLRDIETGAPVSAHAGSISWNEYRRRWVMITVQAGGKVSYLGEVWYAEAETPLGPWVYARKVATHPKYSFYNPKQHPNFAKDHGRILYFEGTYSETFSGNTDPTPRYDYNQLMYKLDLADPRLNLPVPVSEGPKWSTRREVREGADLPVAPFLALERPGAGTVPIVATGGTSTLKVGDPDAAGVVFHALPAEMADPPASTALLHEFVRPRAAPRYSIDQTTKTGEQRNEKPLCRVWKNPMKIALPGASH